MADNDNTNDSEQEKKQNRDNGSDQQDAADAARQARVLESSGVRQEDVSRQTNLTRQTAQDDFEKNIATAGTLATGRSLLEGWRQGEGREGAEGRPEAMVPGRATRPSDAAAAELRSLMRHHGSFAADRQAIGAAERALQAGAKDMPEAQRAAYMAVGSALVRGDAAALEKALKQHAGDPKKDGDPKKENDFKEAMDKLGKDLGSQGIKLDYKPGTPKEGENPAQPGTLTVKREADEREMTVRTDGTHSTTRPGGEGKREPLSTADDRQFFADTAQNARKVGKVSEPAATVPADGSRTTEESVVNPRTGEKEKVQVRTSAIDGKSVEQKMYPDGRIETAINTAGGGEDKRTVVRSVYNPGPPPSTEAFGKDGKKIELNNDTPIARDGKVAIYADGRKETTITDDPKRVKTIDYPANDPEGRGRTTEFRPEQNNGLKTETVMRDGTVQREGRDSRGDYKSRSWNDPDAGQLTQTFYTDGSVVTTNKVGKVLGGDKPVAVAKSKDDHGRDTVLMSDGRTVTDLGDGKRQVDYPENNREKKITEVRDDKNGVTTTTYGDRVKTDYDKGDLASRTVYKDVRNGIGEERQFRGDKGNRSEADVYKNGVKVETQTKGKDDIGEYQGRRFKDADGNDVTQQFYQNGTVKTINAKGESVVQKPGEPPKEVGTVRGDDGVTRKLMSDGSARRETEQGTETIYRDGRTELAYKIPQDAKALGLGGEGKVTKKTTYPADDPQGRTERFDFAQGSRGEQTSETRVKGADGKPSSLIREFTGNGADGKVMERLANGKVVEQRFADGRFVNTPESGNPSSGRRQEFTNQNGEKGSVDVDDRTGRVVGMRFSEGKRAGQEYKFGYDDQGKLNAVTMPDGRVVKPGPDGKFDSKALKEMGFSLGDKDSKDGKFDVRVNNKGDLVATNGDGITQYLRTDGSRVTYDDKNYSRVRENADGTKSTDYWDGYGWRQPKNVRTEGSKTIVEFDQMQGRPRTIERDSAADQLKVKFADGSTYEADWKKQQQVFTDGGGKKTSYFNTGEVNQRGEPIWRKGTAGENGVVDFTKDASRDDIEKMRKGERPIAAKVGADGSVTAEYANGTKIATDGKGQVKSVTYGNGQQYRFERDADGRMNKVVGPDGTTYLRRGDQGVDKDGKPVERWSTYSGQPPRETGKFEGSFRVKNDGTVVKSELGGNSTTHEPNGRSVVTNKQGEEIQITEANGNKWVSERVPGTGNSPENANKRVWKLAGDDKVSFTGERKLNPDGSVSFATAEGTFKRNADGSTSKFEKNSEVERRFANGAYIKRDAETGLPSESKDADGNVRKFDWGKDKDGKPLLKEIKVTGPDGKPGISEMPDSKGVLRQVVKPDAKDDEKFGAEVRYGGDGSRTVIQADKSAVKKNMDGSEFRFNPKGEFTGATIRKPDGMQLEVNDKQQVTEVKEVVPGKIPPETKVVGKLGADGQVHALDEKGEPKGPRMVMTDTGVATQVPDGHFVSNRPDGTKDHLSPNGEFMYSTDKDGKRTRVSDGRGGEAKLIYDDKGALSKIEYRSPDIDGVRTTTAEGSPKTASVQFGDRKETYDDKGRLLRKEFTDKSSIDFDAATGMPTKTKDVYGTERTFKPAGKWPPQEVEVRKQGQKDPSYEKLDNGKLREWDAANKRFGAYVAYDAITGTRFSNVVDGTGKLTGTLQEGIDGTTIEQRGDQRVVKNRHTAERERAESSKPPEPIRRDALPPDVMAIINSADKGLRERPELEKALRGTSEARVDERTGEGATLDFQRKALEAQAKLLPREQREQLLANMKEFEARAKRDGLSEKEVAKTFFQANRLLEARPTGDTITAADTARAAQALIHGAARPQDTNQGFHETCNVTTTREALLTRNPSLAGQVAADVMLSKDGTFVAPDGQRIRIDHGSLRGDKESLLSSQNESYSDKNGIRDQLGQVLDHAFANYAHQRTYKERNGIPADRAVDHAFYTQERPSRGPDDTGERLNRPGRDTIYSSHVNTDQIADLSKTFLGRNNLIVNSSSDVGSSKPIKVGSQADLEKALTEGLKAGPMAVLVNTSHPAISTNHGGGPHVFSVTDTKTVGGQTFFKVSDQGGTPTDKWLSSADLFNATQDVKFHRHRAPGDAPTTPGEAVRPAAATDSMPPPDQRVTSERVKELFGDSLKVDAALAAPFMAAKTDAERAAALQTLATQAAGGNKEALAAARQLMMVDAALALKHAEGGVGWRAEDAQKQAVMRLANLSAFNQAEGIKGTANSAGTFLDKWIGDDVKRQALVERSEAAVEQLRKLNAGGSDSVANKAIAEARAEFLKQSGTPEGREQALKRIGELQAQSLLTTGSLDKSLEAERTSLTGLSKAITDAKGGALPAEAAAALQALKTQNPDIAYHLNPSEVPDLRKSVEAKGDAAALAKFDKAVEHARQEVMRDNQTLSDAMGRYLDRTAGGDQRREAVQQLEALANKQYGPEREATQQTLATLQGLDKAMTLEQSTRDRNGDAGKVIEAAQALRTAANGTPPNAVAQQMLAKLGDAKEVDRLIGALGAADAPTRQAAIEQIQNRLRPAVETAAGEKRVERLTKGLSAESSAEDLRKASEILRAEVRAGNSAAKDWSEWAGTVASLGTMKDAQNAAQLRASFEGLAQQAFQNNPYAKAALANLLSGEGKKVDVNGKSVNVPGFEQLSPEGKRAVQMAAAAAIQSQTKVTGGEIDRATADAVSKSLAKATAAGDADLQNQLLGAVEAAGKGPGKDNMAAAMAATIAAREPGAQALVDSFLKSASPDQLNKAMPELMKSAAAGDDSSLKVVTAAGRLGELGKALAASGADVPEPVREAIHSGLKSESAAERESAASAMAALSKHWSELDMHEMKTNMSPELATALAQASMSKEGLAGHEAEMRVAIAERATADKGEIEARDRQAYMRATIAMGGAKELEDKGLKPEVQGDKRVFTDKDGTKYEVSSTPSGDRLSSMIDSANNRSSYDANGNLTRVDRPDGGWLKVDSKDGVPSRITDSQGNQWEREADGRGWHKNASSERVPGSMAINSDGTYAITDGNKEFAKTADGGTVTTDATTGHKTETKLDGSSITRDSDGRVTRTVDTQGRVSEYQYNKDGQLTGVKNRQGDWSTTDGVNWKNNKTGESWKGTAKVDAAGNLEQQPEGKNKQVLYADGTKATFDDKGRKTHSEDAVGRKFDFTYKGDTNQIETVNYGTGVWRTTDGTNWTKDGTTEKWTGTVEVKDGSYIERSPGGTVRTYQPDGSVQTRNKDGDLTEMTNAFGEKFQFGYSSPGQLNRVQYPDGSVADKKPDGSWGKQIPKGGKEGMEGWSRVDAISLDKATGKLVEKHPTSYITERTSDGRSVTLNAQGLPLVERRADGTTIRNDWQSMSGNLLGRDITTAGGGKETIDAAGARTVTAPDGTVTKYDTAGQVTDVQRKDGPGVHIERDGSGIKSIAATNGIIWDRTADGSYTLRGSNPPQRVQGEPFINPNGDFGFKGPDGRLLQRVADATVVSDGQKSMRYRDDGSTQIVGKDGRVEATQDSRGMMRSVVRDAADPDKIKEVKMGDTTFTRQEGNVWKSKDGKELKGEFKIDDQGNFSFIDATNKLETVYKTDGSTVIRASEGDKRVHRTETSDGKATDYYYSPQGKLIGMRTPDGASYTRLPDDPRGKQPSPERWSKDGTTEIREEHRSVDADGTFHFKPAGGAEETRNSDGWSRRTDASGKITYGKQNADGSIVVKNAQGQIESSADAKLNIRQYGYDAQGQLNSVTYGNKDKWTLQADGKWLKEGSKPPETWTGRMGVTPDGTLVESRTDGGINREVIRKTDGSVLTAENGRFTSITRRDESSLSIGSYDAQGKPNKIAIGSEKGAYWSTTNGTDWTQFGADGKPTGKTDKFSMSVGPDGAVLKTNLGSNPPNLERMATDGTIVTAAQDGRKLSETKRDGSKIEYRYNDKNQFIGKSETKDGTQLETDARGRVTRVKNGSVDRSFEYNDRGDVKAYTEGGKRFELKDGTRDVYVNPANANEGLVAQISVRPDGTMQSLGRDNMQTFFRLDGTTLTQGGDGAMILRDNVGRVTETVQPSGYKMRYEYGGTDVLGRAGGLKSFTYGADSANPVTYRTSDGDKPGFHWRRDGDGHLATSFIRVDQGSGAMREYVASGDIYTRNIDGTQSVEHKDLDSPLAVLREYEDATFSWKSTRERKFAEQLNDKSAEDMFIMSYKWNSDNTDALRSALVKVVGGDDHFRGVHIDGLFRRRDRPTDDLAVQLMVNRAEQNHSWISRDRSMSDIERSDLNILGSANEQTRIGIDNSLRGMYRAEGVTLQNLVQGRVGDQFYQKAMELYSQKGRDIRTVDEQTALMDLALRSTRPLDNFMIATGENIATDDARKSFKANGGADKITAAFTRTEYTEGGGSYEVTDRFAVRQATDYMDRGKLRPATAIEKATGVFSNSDDVVRSTLQNMSKQDQDQYFDGKALADKGVQRENMTEAQRQSFDFYNEMQTAMKGLHWFGKDRKTFGYEAQIGRKDGEGTDLSQKLVEIGGHWTNDHQENLGALENMSRASFDRLMEGARYDATVKRGGDEYRSEFQADLISGMKLNLGSGDYLNRASALLNDKVNFGLKVNEAADKNPAALRDLIPAFRDIPEAGFKDNAKVKEFLAGREVARQIEQIQGATPSETRQKREEFMSNLGRQGEQALESYRQSLFEAAKSEQRRPLLDSLKDNTGVISNDRQNMWDAVKSMSSADRQKYHDDAGYRAQVREQLDRQFKSEGPARKAVDSVLSQIENDGGRPPKAPTTTLVDELNARAGLKGPNAHDTSNMINDALRNDPGLRERLQKDEAFRAQFKEAATAAAGGGDASYDKYVAPLLDKGGLSPQALRELNTHLESSGEGETHEVFDQKGYFKDGVLNASPAALERLKANKEERDALLANITDPKLRQLAEGILTAGEVRPEAKVRAFVLDAGVSKDEVRGILGAKMPEAERRRIVSEYHKFGVAGETANMRNDVMEKVDPPEKHEFMRLTRDAEWSTERTLLNAEDAVARANTGWISGVVRDYNISHEEQMRSFWKEKYDANMDPRRGDLTPEQLEAQWRAVDSAVKSFHADKEATAETVVNGVIMAGAIVAAPFTGGTSLAAIMATGGVIAAGGLVGAGLKYGMLGDSHKGAKQLAEDFAKYSIITATNLLGPEHLAAAFGLGAKAGTAAAEKALADAAFAGLSSEAKDAVGKGMVKLVRDGMAHGGGVTDKAITEMVGRLAQKELVGLSEQAQAQLARSLGSSLRGAVDDVAKTTLRDVWMAAQNRATATALGTTAGVTGNVLASAGVHAVEGKAYTFADFQNDVVSGAMMAAPLTAAFQGIGASASLARRMMGSAESAASHVRPVASSDARVVNTGSATIKEGSMLGHGQAQVRAEGPNTSLVLREGATGHVHDGAFADVGQKAQATLHGKSEGVFTGQSHGVLNDSSVAVVSDAATVTANHNSTVQIQEGVRGSRPTVELKDNAAADIRSGAQVTANGPGTVAVARSGATNVDLTLNNGSAVFDGASGTVKGQGAVTVSGKSRVSIEVPEGQTMTIVVKGGDANVNISPNSKGQVRVVVDEGMKPPAGLAEHPAVKVETQKPTTVAVDRVARVADSRGPGVIDGAASPVDDLIKRYNSGDKSVTQAQVHDALLDYARKEMRRMGFGDSADALVTRDNLVIEKPQGNSRGGYDPRTDVVGIATRTDDGGLASKTLSHELRHRKNTFERTALQKADPEAFRAALVEDVMANVGQGGQRAVEIPEKRFLGVVTRERQIQLQDRMLATPQEAEFMRSTLRQYLTEGKNGALGKNVNENELLDWMIKKDITVPGGDAVRGQQMVREMTAEINHANYVQRTSVISDAAIKANPALAKALDDQVARLQRMDVDGRQTQMEHFLRNRSLDTNALAGDAAANYYQFSTEEIRARRAEMSANLRQVNSDLQAMVKDIKEIEPKNIKGIRDNLETVRRTHPDLAPQIEAKLKDMDKYAENIKFQNSMEKVNRAAQEIRSGKPRPGAQERLDAGIREVLQRTSADQAGTVAHHLYTQNLASGSDIMRLAGADIAGEVANGLRVANPKQFTPQVLMNMSSDSQLFAVTSKLLEKKATTVTDIMDAARGTNRMAAATAAVMSATNPPISLSSLAEVMNNKGRLSEFINGGIEGGAFSRAQVEEAIKAQNGSRHAKAMQEILEHRPAGNDPPVRDFAAEKARARESVGGIGSDRLMSGDANWNSEALGLTRETVRGQAGVELDISGKHVVMSDAAGTVRGTGIVEVNGKATQTLTLKVNDGDTLRVIINPNDKGVIPNIVVDEASQALLREGKAQIQILNASSREVPPGIRDRNGSLMHGLTPLEARDRFAPLDTLRRQETPRAFTPAEFDALTSRVERSLRAQSDTIPLDQWQAMIKGMSAEDQALAAEILRHSAPNMNRRTVDMQLQTLGEHLEKNADTIPPSYQVEGKRGPENVYTVYVPEGMADGKALAHLLDKKANMTVRIEELTPATIEKIKAAAARGEQNEFTRTALVLDDMNKFSAEQKAALGHVQNLVVADLGGFGHGVNMYDVASARLGGPQAVQTKLQDLMKQVKESGLYDAKAPRDSVEMFFEGRQADAYQAEKGQNVVRLGRDAAVTRRLDAIDAKAYTPEQLMQRLHQHATEPMVTKAEMENYLAQVYASSQRTGKFTPERSLLHASAAARALEDGMQMHDYSNMMSQLRTVQDQIVADMKRAGQGDRGIIIVSGTAESRPIGEGAREFKVGRDGSGYLIEHLVSKAWKGEPKTTVMSIDQLAALEKLPPAQRAEILGKNRLVFLDDYRLTGNQQGKTIDALQRHVFDKLTDADGKPLVRDVSVASLGEFYLTGADVTDPMIKGRSVRVGQEVLPGEYGAVSRGGRDLRVHAVSAEHFTEFGGGLHAKGAAEWLPLYREMGIESSWRSSTVGGTMVTPYGMPNNNPTFMAAATSGGFNMPDRYWGKRGPDSWNRLFQDHAPPGTSVGKPKITEDDRWFLRPQKESTTSGAGDRLKSQRSGDIDGLERARQMATPKDQPNAPRRLNADEFPRDMKVREGEFPAQRIVEVNGEQYQVLKNPMQSWFYGKFPDGEGAVKVHVTTDGAADLGRLQQVLIPALNKDPELSKLVSGWKTFDPMIGTGELKPERGVPNGERQMAKAFTIYAKTADEAARVQARIDQILQEKGLHLDRPIESGNVDSIRGQSNRVGIVRDMYEPTTLTNNYPAAKLDAPLQDHIHSAMGLKPGERLSFEQLREVEKRAGIMPETLHYNGNGELSLQAYSHNSQKVRGENNFYLDESRAEKEHGKLTDRPAMYALGKEFLPNGADPSDVARGLVTSPPEFATARARGDRMVGPEKPPVLEKAVGENKPVKPVEKLTLRGAEIQVEPGGPEVPIGRLHQDTIDNRNVSRNHATIGRDADGQYFIRDNGSTYGTYVKSPTDGQWRKVEGVYKLRGDERIMLGGIGATDLADRDLSPANRRGTEVKLHPNADRPAGQFEPGRRLRPEEQVPRHPDWPQGQLPAPSKRVEKVAFGNTEISIEPGGAEVPVGRNHQMEVDNRNVSRNHAFIGRNADGQYYIRDTGSTQGTFVKGPDNQWRKIEGTYTLRGDEKIMLGGTGAADGDFPTLMHENRKGTELRLKLAPEPPKKVFADGGIGSMKVAGEHYDLKPGQEVLVGRTAENGMPLDVSRKHVYVGRDADGNWYMRAHENSTYGTWIKNPGDTEPRLLRPEDGNVRITAETQVTVGKYGHKVEFFKK